MHKGTAPTKRGVLSRLAKIYDPLGLASPTTLQGKLFYREICETNLAWDAVLPEPLKRRWDSWCANLPEWVTVPRTLAPCRQRVSKVTLHAFGDASIHGVAAAVYAVVQQKEGTTQGLVCAKARLAKRNLTIPRLELVSGHMAVNLATNARSALNTHAVSTVHCWLDSTVALYWIKGRGEYRQFVSNRVHKIQQHADIEWHHVPTTENPADLGSRGGTVTDHQLWKQGPSWLSFSQWPPDITPTPSREAKSEFKTSQSIITTAIPVQAQDNFDKLLEAHALRKVLRIGAWIQRFIRNCRTLSENRMTGLLEMSEIEDHNSWWIKRAQSSAENDVHFEEDKL